MPRSCLVIKCRFYVKMAAILDLTAILNSITMKLLCRTHWGYNACPYAILCWDIKGSQNGKPKCDVGAKYGRILPLNSLCGVKFGNVEKNLFSCMLLPRVKFLQSLCQFLSTSDQWDLNDKPKCDFCPPLPLPLLIAPSGTKPLIELLGGS